MTNQVQVYINDQLIDLRPGTVIAKTIQAFDLFAFGTARANYTNQISAPKTNNNQKALQFVDNIKSASTYAYQLLPARIIQNGIELIGNGFAQIVSTDTSYNITFFDGNYGFFTQIANRKLWDIDLTPFNNSWGQRSDFEAARNNNSGLVSAIINFGNLIASGANINAATFMLNAGGVPGAFQPSLFYKSLIDRLFATFNYAYSGNVFTNGKFLKMIMPLTSIYSPKFCTAKEFSASAPGTQVMVNPGAGVKVTFNNVAVNGSDNFYNGIDTWTVAFTQSANYYFMCNFAALLNITVAGGTASLDLVFNNGVTATQTIGGVGTGTYLLQTVGGLDSYVNSAPWKNASSCYVQIRSGAGVTVTINSGVFWNKVPVVSPGSNWTLAVSPTYMVTQHLLPDMLITDFLKDFAIRFGLLFKETKGAIIARNIDELINDTGNAVDWTAKRDKSIQEKVTYQFSNFSQSNKLKWAVEADNTLNSDFAGGSLDIGNPNLSPEQTITSPFSATQTLATLGINMAQCIYFDNTVPKFTATIDKRLLLLRNPYTNDPTVQFDVLFKADYQIGYFLDGKQPYQMLWSQFISDAYTQFSIRMQNAKMVIRSYNLNDLDINNFDQFKLIYDDGAYFIVNKIINYAPGKSTSVELFKV